MYFFKIEPLKQKLRDGTLTEREALPYYLLMLALMGLVPLPEEHVIHVPYVHQLFTTALSLLGLIYAFDQNGGRAGSNFLQKAILLGWVLGLRLIVCLFAIMFVAAGVFVFMEVPTEPNPQVVLVVECVFLFVFYLWLGKHLKDTHHVANPQPILGIPPLLPARTDAGR